jgi:hypothetical protein
MTNYDDVSDTIHLQGLGSALPTLPKSGEKSLPSINTFANYEKLKAG